MRLLSVHKQTGSQKYASGAFNARFHFQELGKLYVTCKQQSEFEDFAIKKVASETILYLRTESALLNNFVDYLRGLHAEKCNEAYLEAI